MSAAVDASFIDVVSKLDAAREVDRSAFVAGIDRVVPVDTDLVGPHLLTTSAALEIEQSGQAFLQAAKSTLSRLNINDAASTREIFSEGLAFPAKRILPERLRCPYSRDLWPMCPSGAKYRTADGSCNNLLNPLWGRSQTPFERYLNPAYDDGFSEPRTQSVLGGGVQLPNARKISREFHTNLMNFLPNMNHLTMEYGQFLSHDIQFNALSKGYDGSNLECCESPDRPGCFPIEIPPGDPFFPPNRTCMNLVRALPTPNLECTVGVREQLNQNTHFIDGSHIYGSDKTTADSLRTFVGGKLSTNNDLLPSGGAGCIVSDASRPCFRAGDPRVNQQPALASLQTVWVREHNRLVAALAALRPSWSDETLYQEARKIVIAIIQHVSFNEYLQEILGQSTMIQYGLKPLASGHFGGYSDSEKPIIRNGFSAAAFRFGHSMIYHRIQAHNGAIKTSDKLLKDEFLRPDLVYSRGVGEICRGLTRTPSEAVDKYLTEQVTRHLFERAPGFGGDLAAINIQRARDHGIPGYQAWRRFCGLSGQFSHAASVQAQLLQIYSSPEDIDLFTGGVSETPLGDGKVGPTFACIIGQQFQSLKKGDRFYYENSGDVGFTIQQLNQIRTQTLAKVICRNTDITKLQANAFRNTDTTNPLVDCSSIKNFNLSPWGAGSTGCTPVNGGWSAWKLTPCYVNRRFRYRICDNPTPNACGVPCSAPFEVKSLSCRPRFAPIERTIGLSPEVSDVAPEFDPAFDPQIQAAILAQVQGDTSRVDAATMERALTNVAAI
ncbi:chorion peroxidase-like [Dreissena polymorpha]|uniref:chorion peroxidase-like n=1 Tax=Dreissena polymorpha TaxID=45954 RepID=UPI002264CA1E|nr:chorion peroxidase-like [Dreissena polymorpha]